MKLQKWKRTETRGSVRAAREIGERPPYFGFRLQKSAIEFYESLPQNVRDSYDEFVKPFPNNYSEKPVVFSERLARVQQPGQKLTIFLGHLNHFAQGIPRGVERYPRYP